MDQLFADETILARWLNDELTDAEAKALREHEAYADLQAIVREVDQLQIKNPRDATADYAALRSRLAQAKSPLAARQSRLYPWRWAAAAAVIILAAASWFWLRPQATVYVTQSGEKKEIGLPDGSEVVLNAVSELKVFTDAWSTERRVDLSGEAFFRVASGTPFVIHTTAGTVEVLGTTFNVYVRNGMLESLCTEGRIRTSSEDGTVSHISMAGEGVRISNNQLALQFVVDPTTTQWPAGESYFEEAPIARILAELERQFSIEIQYDASLFDDTDAFTGWFDNQDLDKALRNVLIPLRVEYERNGDVLILRAK